MSLLAKTSQIFSFVGALSATPFIPSLTDNNAVPLTKLTAGGDEEKVVPEPAPAPQPNTLPRNTEQQGNDVLQAAANQIIASEDSERVSTADTVVCFWVEKFRKELFFCFNKSVPTVPYLFHYSWAREDKGKSTSDRLHWVDSISNYTQMAFKKGGNGNISSYLKSALYWTGKQTPFKPSDRCRITLESEKYKLTCTKGNGNPPNQKDYELAVVSEREVVELNSNLKHSESLPLQ